ncbi:MAG: hemolysin III family protein [Blautia sp.]|nr:hemolysin III family protein [Blautia sp.]
MEKAAAFVEDITITKGKPTKRAFPLKDPGSAITHGIGFLLAGLGGIMLVTKAAAVDSLHVISFTIFIVTMMMLYGASTLYHSINASPETNRILRKLDHSMIFVMIAGSYTPVCLIVLHNRIGVILLALVWGIAALGIIFKLCWITCPKWVSSVLYIGMGWLCVLAFVPIFHGMPLGAFLWLLLGGIIYTIGGVIYALKLPLFNARHKNFGTHEIFHVFIMAGSLCHFIVMYVYIMNI